MIPVPEHVLTALAAAYQLNPAALAYLGGGKEDSDGIAYTYLHGRVTRVLKIMALPLNDPDGLLRLEERLKFMHFMGQRGVHVVHPLAQPNGSLYTTQPDGVLLYVAYTYRKIAGKSGWSQAFTPDQVRLWGQVIGALHRHTQDYPTWQHSPAPGGRSVLGWREEWQGFYEWCKDDEVRQRWESIRQRLEALPVHRQCFGMIHNDPHAANIVLTRRGGIALLDFDVANYHWFATDIAIALQSTLFSRSGGFDRPVSNLALLRQFLDTLMQGYALENTLDSFWLTQLDLFIAYRRILLFTVLQEWLSTEPQKRHAWKQMILEEPPILS